MALDVRVVVGLAPHVVWLVLRPGHSPVRLDVRLFLCVWNAPLLVVLHEDPPFDSCRGRGFHALDGVEHSDLPTPR